jgi:DNA-binding transcriptional regulator YiaG
MKKRVRTPMWSDRVKKLIEREGSIETLAGKLGVNFFTVLRWRQGKSKPSHLAQKKIVEMEVSA